MYLCEESYKQMQKLQILKFLRVPSIYEISEYTFKGRILITKIIRIRGFIAKIYGGWLPNPLFSRHVTSFTFTKIKAEPFTSVVIHTWPSQMFESCAIVYFCQYFWKKRLKFWGSTQFKRPYRDVPPTWVAKPASWYMNDPLWNTEFGIWIVNLWVACREAVMGRVQEPALGPLVGSRGKALAGAQGAAPWKLLGFSVLEVSREAFSGHVFSLRQISSHVSY